MFDDEFESANDDFVLQETLFETILTVLVSIGAITAFAAALLYSFRSA